MRIELYNFEAVHNNTTVVTGLTSSSASVDFNGLTYEPTPIGRGKIVSTSQLSKAKLKVKMSLSSDFAASRLNPSVDDILNLTLYTKINGDAPTVTWTGRLASVSAEGKVITLIFETVFTSMRRTGLRKKYQRTCPYSLYGKGCKADRTNFSDTETVVSLDGPTLVFSNTGARPDGFFNGGLVEASDGSLRYIESHVGSTLNLSRELTALHVGEVVLVAAGCNRTRSDCDTKFSNIENYGGFPFIPVKNPFGGSSVA